MTRHQLLKRLVPPTPKSLPPPKQPDPSESLLQEKLTPLVQALAHPDEPCRRAAVEHVMRNRVPALIARLIDRLVDLLDGDGTTRRQAIASLAQFGGRARIDLMTEVLALTKFAADASVGRDLAGLVAVARTANEADSRSR